MNILSTTTTDPATIGGSTPIPASPTKRTPHTRLELLTRAAITPARVAGLLPRVDPVAARLTDALVQDLRYGTTDLVQAYIEPLALQSTTELFGIPLYARARFLAWTAQAVGGPAPGQAAALIALNQCLAGLFSIRREVSDDDLLSALLATGTGAGEGACDTLLAEAARMLLVAGYHATVGLLGSAVATALLEPDQAGGRFGDRPAHDLIQHSSRLRVPAIDPHPAQVLAVPVAVTGLDTLVGRVPGLRWAGPFPGGWSEVGPRSGPRRMPVVRG